MRPRTAATRDRVRAASAAAQAAAATTAMPGELEDLGGGSSAAGVADEPLPDKAELERLRSEVARADGRDDQVDDGVARRRDRCRRQGEGRRGAWCGRRSRAATSARPMPSARGCTRCSPSSRALESELKELERAIEKIKDMPPPRAASSAPRSSSADSPPPPSLGPARVDRRSAGGAEARDRRSEARRRRDRRSRARRIRAARRRRRARRSSAGGNVDDELAALKKKMQNAPPKKK